MDWVFWDPYLNMYVPPKKTRPSTKTAQSVDSDVISFRLYMKKYMKDLRFVERLAQADKKKCIGDLRADAPTLILPENAANAADEGDGKKPAIAHDRFLLVLPHKLYIHYYINNLVFKKLHVIDTRHNHSKRLMTKHKVVQMGYDFNLPSTKYLEQAKQEFNDVVWLDYCCTPSKNFVKQDVNLCRTKWVFCTFSIRGTKWKSTLRQLVRNTVYRLGWVYKYRDTSAMIFVALYVRTPPAKLVNPVGRKFKFKYNSKWYKRTCLSLLAGPSDESDHPYLQFRDSNEPVGACTPCV